jgi:hypothetical protein
MKRILLAGLLGGLVAFVWSAVVHMNPLTACLGLSMFNEKEDAVLAELRGHDLSPGLYFFPGMDMSKSMTKEQEAAWTAKFKAGPSGLLLLQPKGGDPMEVRQLLLEFFSTALCAIIAATILATTVGSVTCRAIMVAMMGLFGWLALNVSQWNWYHYPFSFIALDLIDQSIGWLLAGFLIAKLVKPIQPLPGSGS